MRRREFFEAGALLATSQAARGQSRKSGRSQPIKMKLGTQHGDSEEILRTMAAFGVNHICSNTPSMKMDEKWSVEGLTQLRERVEKYGIKLEMVQLPTSADLAHTGFPNIMLGKSPERDREIEQVCQMVRNVAKAGIPNIKYNITLLGVVRTESTPGRGGAMYSTFDYSKVKPGQPLTAAGEVSADAHWERITYFLERVIPVATEYKIRMGLHPHDPPMPKNTPYRGVHRVLGSVEGLKRFVEIKASPYHGLNFCQGTVCEMLEKPGEQIYDVIRYFGERKKIFNVHFRNIKGGFLKFQETFPDNGDVDMIRALRIYRDVGYDGMIMPDHAPHIEGDTGTRQAFAFEFGYIAALMQLMRQEA
jgi:mannonate dehydratase